VYGLTLVTADERLLALRGIDALSVALTTSSQSCSRLDSRES
jgi:hypothetical protein